MPFRELNQLSECLSCKRQWVWERLLTYVARNKITGM